MHSLRRPYGRLIKFIILLSIFLFTMGGISCTVGEVLVEVAQNTIELKVMTYNVYHPDPDGPEYKKWKNRKEAIVEMIDFREPDVIGFQEAIVGQVDYLHGNLPQYEVSWAGRDGGEEGETCAIFYLGERFYLQDEGTFWFSDNPWKPRDEGDLLDLLNPFAVARKVQELWDPYHNRICSWVRLVERETGKAFYFYNLHLEHGSDGATVRMKSVELLGEKIDARAHPENLFIVVGDFNAKPNEDPIEYVVDDLGYLDTYAETNEDMSEGYTSVGWDRDTRRRIDYIFTHPNALLTDSYVLKRYYSDHLPLITKLLLPIEISE